MTKQCSMPNCDRRAQGRGLCKMHWARWKRWGDPSIVHPKGSGNPSKKPCLVESCNRMSHAHGYCQMHLARWHRHGSPYIVGAVTGRPLKGDVPGWAAIHKRLRRIHGPAREHICVDCGGPAAEWSYDHEDANQIMANSNGSWFPYSLDLNHYTPRCRSCHRRFDKSWEKRQRNTNGTFGPSIQHV